MANNEVGYGSIVKLGDEEFQIDSRQPQRVIKMGDGDFWHGKRTDGSGAWLRASEIELVRNF